MTNKDLVRALPVKERTELVRLLQQYLRDHFDLEAGDLGAELLLQRAGELVGPIFWNKALEEASLMAKEHAESMAVDLLANQKELERRH